MPFRKTKWTYLLELDPAKAKRELVAAVKKANGNMGAVAKEMGIARSTLYTYLQRLDLGTPTREANDACRRCGCTEEAACPEGCSWVESNLCSACAEPRAEAEL